MAGIEEKNSHGKKKMGPQNQVNDSASRFEGQADLRDLY
jgi:hypothetical protein